MSEDSATSEDRFKITYSESVADILHHLNLSLVVSTYQAGKLIFIGAPTPNKLHQTPVTFRKPMGVASGLNILGVASLDRVEVFTNQPHLAETYPPAPGMYDSMYFPRTTYHSGPLDLHDLHWTKRGLIAVNTRFSCLCRFDYRYNFTPFWQPHFISDLLPEDRCHLNGLAMQDGEPAVVSSLGAGDEADSWRKSIKDGGALIDCDSNEIITRGLCMPHSPRIDNGQLFLLESGRGELVRVDQGDGSKQVVARMDGFVRGMSICDDLAFIGMSKIRMESKSAKALPVADIAQHSGVEIINIRTGARVGWIRYESTVEEIYDVQLIKNSRMATLVTTKNKLSRLALSLPNKYIWNEAIKKQGINQSK